MFYVFGDYGYESQTELHSTPLLSDAVRWADGYTKGNDMGGYSIIEVASFADDGEYLTYWRKDDDNEE